MRLGKTNFFGANFEPLLAGVLPSLGGRRKITPAAYGVMHAKVSSCVNEINDGVACVMNESVG